MFQIIPAHTWHPQIVTEVYYPFIEGENQEPCALYTHTDDFSGSAPDFDHVWKNERCPAELVLTPFEGRRFTYEDINHQRPDFWDYRFKKNGVRDADTPYTPDELLEALQKRYVKGWHTALQDVFEAMDQYKKAMHCRVYCRLGIDAEAPKPKQKLPEFVKLAEWTLRRELVTRSTLQGIESK